LEYSTYFIVSDLILVVCGFNRTIRAANVLFSYFIVYEDFDCLGVDCRS
jgi:hypothetical protein